MTVVFCLTTFLPIGIVLGVCAGPAVRNGWARSLGGVWRQHGFTCTGCGKHCHIARPGPIATTLCLNCSPAPAHGGNR